MYYVDFRRRLIKRALSVAQATFTSGDNFEHPYDNARSRFSCRNALQCVYRDSWADHISMPHVYSDIHIPGDWAYIYNTDHQQYGGSGEGNVNQGENIMYLGDNEFFGLVTGSYHNKFKSLGEWKNYVGARMGPAQISSSVGIPLSISKQGGASSASNFGGRKRTMEFRPHALAPDLEAGAKIDDSRFSSGDDYNYGITGGGNK